MIEQSRKKYYEAFSFEQSLASAKSLDLDVVLPKDNELFIDLDSEESFEYYKQQLQLLEAQLPDLILYTSVTFSKSGAPNRHVVVTLNMKVTNLERILLQAVLVSDRRRELISYIKEVQGDPHPTLFFEAKQIALPPAPEPKGLLVTNEELQMACDHEILTDKDCPF